METIPPAKNEKSGRSAALAVASAGLPMFYILGLEPTDEPEAFKKEPPKDGIIRRAAAFRPEESQTRK